MARHFGSIDFDQDSTISGARFLEWVGRFRIPTLLALMLALGACPAGSARDDDGDDDDDNGGDGDVDGDGDGDGDDPNCVERGPEDCHNAIDDDCDRDFDCGDEDCVDHPACSFEGCGELQILEGSLELPDGACPEDEAEPCDGYESEINFTGFTDGQELLDITKLNGICVNMEHTWMRDLVIYAQCPSGVRVMLSDFVGHEGGEVYLGVPNDDDWDVPDPGVGWDYCWTPEATNLPWIPYANDTGVGTLPAGDYQSSESLDAFLGCPLNGEWTLRVEDRWAMDNGFIFSWSVKFDPSIVEDCSNWLE